jgi:hypothetical protein
MIDSKVLYTQTDWTDSEVQQRFRSAENYELLATNHVPMRSPEKPANYDKSRGAGQKTSGGVPNRDPKACHHRAPQLDSEQRHEIRRQQLRLPEMTEVGQNYHLWIG